MATLTKEKVEVNVNVMEKSVTFMTNMLFQLFFRIAKGRNLESGYLVHNKEIIENGLFTWLSEQTLEMLFFEVISPDGSMALERWEITFDYSADPDMEVRKPPVEEVEDLCKKLRSLPPGAHYRILVHTSDNATKVSGWQSSRLLPFNQKQEQDLSGWGFGNVGGKLYYREGEF